MAKDEGVQLINTFEQALPTVLMLGPDNGAAQPGVVWIVTFLDTHLSSDAHRYIAQTS